MIRLSINAIHSVKYISSVFSFWTQKLAGRSKFWSSLLCLWLWRLHLLAYATTTSISKKKFEIKKHLNGLNKPDVKSIQSNQLLIIISSKITSFRWSTITFLRNSLRRTKEDDILKKVHSKDMARRSIELSRFPNLRNLVSWTKVVIRWVKAFLFLCWFLTGATTKCFLTFSHWSDFTCYKQAHWSLIICLDPHKQKFKTLCLFLELLSLNCIISCEGKQSNNTTTKTEDCSCTTGKFR